MSRDAAAQSKPVPALEPDPSPPPRYGTTVGILVEVREGKTPVVEFEGHGGQVMQRPALSTIPLDPGLAGHPIVLMYVEGDLDRPIVTGCIEPGLATPRRTTRTKTLMLDGRALVLEADSSLTLRCGKASITLSREGRIVLRGTQLVSHASGVNRIRGGTIKLN